MRDEGEWGGWEAGKKGMGSFFWNMVAAPAIWAKDVIEPLGEDGSALVGQGRETGWSQPCPLRERPSHCNSVGAWWTLSPWD